LHVRLQGVILRRIDTDASQLLIHEISQVQGIALFQLEGIGRLDGIGYFFQVKPGYSSGADTDDPDFLHLFCCLQGLRRQQCPEAHQRDGNEFCGKLHASKSG